MKYISTGIVVINIQMSDKKFSMLLILNEWIFPHKFNKDIGKYAPR